MEEFFFARPSDERASGLDVSILLTREEQKLGKILSPLGQVAGIKLGEFDLKVRRSNGLDAPTWYTWVTCSN